MAATRYTNHITISAAPERRRGAIDGGTLVLGTVLSVSAALVAVLLAALGDVSQWSLVTSVAVVGFVASWVRSGQPARRRPAIVTVHH